MPGGVGHVRDVLAGEPQPQPVLAEIISDLTAKAGELVADRYEADFDALHLRLATFPESGPLRPKLAGRGLASAPAPKAESETLHRNGLSENKL